MIKWISVNDELPNAPYEKNNISQTVLIFDGKYIGIGYYESEYNIDNDPDRYEGQNVVYSSESWHSDVDYINSNNITHWANLPENP